MRFEARELKPYAEPVPANELKVGEVYFSAQFLDSKLLIPVLEPWIYAGRKLDPKDEENHHYFQDVTSYHQGIRYESATEENSQFQVAADGGLNHFFEYERALDLLLACSLRRKKAIR